MSSLRMGILVDSLVKQKALAQLVINSGHQLQCQILLSPTKSAIITAELDAWLVDVAEDYPDEHHLLEQLFTESITPIIFNDSSEFREGSDAYKASLKRTEQRLRRLSSDINLRELKPAQDLWILAASTGGPAAVKRFLSRLPSNLGIVFLYVQHIDPSQSTPLNRMMTSAGGYPALVANQGMVLAPNRVILITAREQIAILDNRTLSISSENWKGDYSPSIDQISANAARIYRQHCGLIIFTGMGDDGADACRLVKQMGGQIWVQTPDQCTSDSMPKSAIATGCVSHIGTPEILAKWLTELYQ